MPTIIFHQIKKSYRTKKYKMKTPVLKTSADRFKTKGVEHSSSGTILIPDISGFTKFVNETEFTVGREITKQLLQVIIDNNILQLKISEIEGDAVLFYKKNVLSPLEIKNQYELMLNRFKEKIQKLSLDNGFRINLSLKMIVHFGELSTYTISNFEKLYGKAVIEAHNLLKNSISSSSYLLLTDNVFRANRKKFKGTCYYSGSQLCRVYGNLEKIGYTYFNYEDDKNTGTIKLINNFSEFESKLNISKVK